MKIKKKHKNMKKEKNIYINFFINILGMHCKYFNY